MHTKVDVPNALELMSSRPRVARIRHLVFSLAGMSDRECMVLALREVTMIAAKASGRERWRVGTPSFGVRPPDYQVM
jgi:hypothetical protein